MLAPRSNRSPEILATIPVRSGQESVKIIAGGALAAAANNVNQNVRRCRLVDAARGLSR
jgi:hypothetical protein